MAAPPVSPPPSAAASIGLSAKGYGDFGYICSHVPSYPICNLFVRQLLHHPPGGTEGQPDFATLGLPDPGTNKTGFDDALDIAGVGVQPRCSIPRMGTAGGQSGSNGNVANIVVCAISVFISLALAAAAGRRLAAVGRLEIMIFFALYALTCIFQLLDTGSFLRQGSTTLIYLTGVHEGLVVGLFWTLAWVGFLSLQVVEDGTLASLIPYVLGLILTVVGPAYIAIDTALGITDFFRSGAPDALHSAWLYSLEIVWPLVAILFYSAVTIGVVITVLRERRPLAFLLGTLGCFALSQGAYWALSHTICHGSKRKIDGSFIATILETFTVVFLFSAWRSITEDAWDDYTINSSGFLV